MDRDTDTGTAGRTLVAYAAEDGRLDAIREAAVQRARDESARLILYDVDAAGVFQKPLPTEWSGEGSERQFGDVLGPGDLERAGRHPIAQQVADARAAGVDAWGWLPGDLGEDELAEYLQRVGADVLLVPERIGQPGGPLEDLVRARPDEIADAAEAMGVEVVVMTPAGAARETDPARR
jgi:hypothetical protein